MSRKIRRFLVVLLSVLVVLGILLGAVGYLLPRRSFPQVDGEIRLEGLEAAVDVYRDAYGIPHIYAETTHDLFFAQGYVHAQDRFWQMDFWRHIGSARLSEMFGESQLETDRFLRTLGWARVCEQELTMLEPAELAILQTYADGVNAYLADHQGAALSLEYSILGLLTPGYTPEPWQPLHVITWAKAMAWNLGEGRLWSEIQHAVLLNTLTVEQIEQLFPPYPSDQPFIIPGFTLEGQTHIPPAVSPGQELASLAPAFELIARRSQSVQAVLGQVGRGIGSNNWVIAGSRTATGMPLLANDMHLAEQIPSIWYEVGLHCVPKGAACPFEAVGYSFAGVPGIIAGHTDRAAWGYTNVGPDVIDLYIEKINPDNPNQYEVNGEWVDMQLVRESIRVAGSDAVDITIRYTRHGPLLYDSVEDRAEIQESWGIELPEDFAIAVRWTALEPTRVIKAIFEFNRAQNWDEFRQAAAYFAAPSQNLVYADVDGNIAYQMLGNIPIRQPGHSGQYPVPGWTDEYEWLGYIPFDQVPTILNPEQGYIVTANNAVVGPDYPYVITREWDYGFRAGRIIEMIENAPEPITAEYIQQIHGDNRNQSAVYMVPLVLEMELEDVRQAVAQELLVGWDYQDHMNLAAPALYNAFWRAVLARTFHDDLPEDYWPSGDDVWFEVMRRLVQQPDSPWWDDQATAQVETRVEIFNLAFVDAVSELEEVLGRDPADWRWGDLHTTIFHHQTLGMSGVAPIEAIFNRGPYPTSGGGPIVNATSWNAADPDPLTAYQIVWLPSMRMIVDLSSLADSLSLNTTGQSGHAYHPHYVDQVDLWRNIQYHPMLWERTQVEAAAESHLRLTP